VSLSQPTQGLLGEDAETHEEEADGGGQQSQAKDVTDTGRSRGCARRGTSDITKALVCIGSLIPAGEVVVPTSGLRWRAVPGRGILPPQGDDTASVTLLD
jgi:hypothetical protein